MIGFYYFVKPVIPRRLQIFLRRQGVFWKHKGYRHIWPVDPDADTAPDGWNGWPEGKRFSLILTHDVETLKGRDRCLELADMDHERGFRSSFNFVPERYNTPDSILESLKKRGHEVGVHGLLHDGKLFVSPRVWRQRAPKINEYLRKWGSAGFRAPAMHRNLDWINDLNIEYDASTFDTDPFEPQSDGIKTIFPFWVQSNRARKGYVELPYTLAQDHTLFVIMREKSINIWKRKLDWVAEKGGMALLNTHPDYMNFNDTIMAAEEYPSKYYQEFLEYIKTRYEGQYWHVLPREMARFWRKTMVGEP